MVVRWTRPAILVFCLVLFGSACGGSSDEPATGDRGARAATSDRLASGSTAVAGAQQLRSGDRAILLRVPRVGRFIAICTSDGRSAVRFVAAQRLPTAAVTVSRASADVLRRTLQPGDRLAPNRDGADADFQVWQVEPFAKTNARVTTAWVAMGESPGAPAYTCGFSAHAVTTSEPPTDRP